MLIAFITNGGNDNAEPGDNSTHPWTSAGWSGNYFNPGQFPGPGGPGACGMWYREVVPGESATVLSLVHTSSTDNCSAWVYQLAGVSLTDIQTLVNKDVVVYALGGPVSFDSPSAGANSIWIGGWALQKVNYGQATVCTTTEGVGLADVTGANNPTAGHCADGDPDPPTVHIGYAEGTGVLTLETIFECSGATPDYEDFGRGYAGVLLERDDNAFSVVQEGFGTAFGADFAVTLPAAP